MPSRATFYPTGRRSLRHSRPAVFLARIDLVTPILWPQARHMDKLRTTPADAISDLPDGASIAVSGFGQSAGAPFSLLAALDERGTRDICFVANTIPVAAQALIEAGRVSHLIVSFTARAGGSSPAEELIRAGRMTFELVPQGTLVERLRAAGAGLAGFYTRTGLDTPIADGKEVRNFDGKPYLL